MLFKYRAKEWGKTILAYSVGQVKYKFYLSIKDYFSGNYTNIRASRVNDWTEKEHVNYKEGAEYRNIPLSYLGMSILLGKDKKQGTIINYGNNGAHIEILLNDGSYCWEHPNYLITYLDKNNNIVYEFKD